MIATRARRRAAAGVLAAAALSGCATSRVSVVERGDSATALAAGAAFRMAPAGDPADASVRAALAERLIGLGLVERDPPQVLFDLGLSARPLRVGAHDSAARPPRDRPDAWYAPPGRRMWWTSGSARICTLDVQGVEVASGREVYGVRAELRRRKADCDAVTGRLLDRALARPAPPPGGAY